MAIKLEVVKADLSFEAGFPQPEFEFLRDELAPLLHRLFKRLEPHGLRLSDLRVERGSGSVGDLHILAYLFNYWMAVRVRVDRIEVMCSEVPRNYLEKFKVAIVGVLMAINDHRPDLSFRTFTLAFGLHARLEARSVRDYLAQFVANVPKELGPPTGNGAVFYFGTEGQRLLSSVTADVSGFVPDAAYFRIHSVWDAKKVAPELLLEQAEGFVRCALDSLGLQLPT